MWKFARFTSYAVAVAAAPCAVFASGLSKPVVRDEATQQRVSVLRRALPCVARVQGVSNIGRANGSAFIISEDGVCVTNAHVISGLRDIHAERIELHFDDGHVQQARILAADPLSDIGLLKIVPHNVGPGAPPSFPFLNLGKASDLEPGDVVHAIGAPLGGKLTVSSGTFGYTSYLIDDSTIDTRFVLRGQDDWQLLQIGCSIMEGNSGGPVINANGDVVGIAAMGKSSGKGIGSLSFAISIDQATRIIDALRRDGFAVRGKVGMSIALLQAPFAGLGLPPDVDVGIVVTSVAMESPAWESGIRAGDVIVKINGKAARTKGQYFSELGPVYEPGKQLLCDVMRPHRTSRHAVQWEPVQVTLVPQPDRWLK